MNPTQALVIAGVVLLTLAGCQTAETATDPGATDTVAVETPVEEPENSPAAQRAARIVARRFQRNRDRSQCPQGSHPAWCGCFDFVTS